MKNLQGDITEIVDLNGQIVVSYEYDGYGNCLAIRGSEADGIGELNPYRYRGYRYEDETKLYYLNARYYDSMIGRFINADEVDYLNPQSLNNMNLFAYCANNPVMYSDRTGHFWETVFDIGFLIWDIVELCTDNGYKDWKNWAALGVDLLFTAIPFVTGGGSKIIKLANIGDDISDFSKVTVIGETMKRVETVSQFVNATDNLYDGFSAYGKLSKIPAVGKGLAEIGGKASNIAWLYNKVQSGYKIVDIGIDIGRVSKNGKLFRSSSYIAERTFLAAWKYRNIWKLPYHIF